MLPPLNSGISYQITATAVDEQFNAASAVITVSKPIEVLAWDPGVTHPGTVVKNSPHALGGPHIFKITTLNTSVGVWRTALNVSTNEADVYIRYGSPPTTGNFSYSSARVGSDGFCLSQNGQFSPAQDWYYLLQTTTGAAWNLVSGEAFVQQLPALAADASSGTNSIMGAESMRFFKTTISNGTLAWRLGLNGLPNQILVKKTGAPHPVNSGYYDLQQNGQMLVVPTYLNIGDQYFVGVVGAPGLNFNLDSRQQVVTDLAFNSNTNFTLAANSYGYVTYRVQVPVQQIAWQLNLTPTSGDANVAVRQNDVPNEFVNAAYSDSAITADSVTLVPPTLTDGTWYVTVYGNSPYSCSPREGTGCSLPSCGQSVLLLELELCGQLADGLSGGAAYDWTGYNGPTGTNEYGHILQMGMGDPLEPGRYVIGVFTGGENPNGLSYTLASRGIGTNLSIPIGSLTFSNGTVSTNFLAAREVAYYRIVVPTNMASWKMQLTPTTGEALFLLQRDHLPNVAAYYNFHPASLSGGKKLQKPGNDHYLMLPNNGQSNIASGTYYLAVVSEGQNPNYSDRIGTNGSGFTFRSIGTIGITNLVALDSSGFTDLTQNDGMEGTESRIYQFNVPPGTLSLEVRLENRVGNPQMTLRNDSQIPTPYESAGRDGGQPAQWQHASLINIANPPLGPYTLTVSAAAYVSGYSNASYTVRVHALGTIPVAFDGGAVPIAGQAASDWQYFIINVPSNAFGWDLRLTNVTSGDPRMSVRRAVLPDALYTHIDNPCCYWYYNSSPNWPTGYQFGATYDWTGFNGTNGANEYGHVMQLGMGNPLEPGLYYIGVIAGSGAAPLSYTLASRGIGTNLSIPIVNIPFAGGLATNTGLPARDIAFYSVNVPSNMPSWKVRLATGVGDALMMVQKDYLPNVGAYYFDAVFNTNGFSNVASNTLADQARAYYRVIVPTNFEGAPVIGWKLDLSQTTGTPSVRVRKDILPDDNYNGGTSPYAQGEAVIVPTYLTPGTWFVEVKAKGTTSFRLVSSGLKLEGMAWQMPMIGQSVNTPGLPPTGPLFGDTGVDTNGIALPLDQGIDLEQGNFHYYAVVVPTNNVGVMRTTGTTTRRTTGRIPVSIRRARTRLPTRPCAPARPTTSAFAR